MELAESVDGGEEIVGAEVRPDMGIRHEGDGDSVEMRMTPGNRHDHLGHMRAERADEPRPPGSDKTDQREGPKDNGDGAA